MKKIILCKFGEIALKGANRAYFEKLLKVELKKRLRNFGKFKIYSAQSTVYIEPLEDGCDMDAAFGAAKKEQKNNNPPTHSCGEWGVTDG